MFTPLGLFKDVPCPQGSKCTLLTCIFSHTDVSPTSVAALAPSVTPRVADSEVAPEGSPALKRRKAEAPNDGTGEKSRSSLLTNTKSGREQISTTSKTSDAARRDSSQTPNRDVKSLQSATRGVSPPKRAVSNPKGSTTAVKSTSQTSEASPMRIPQRQAPKESLNPRMITKAPASHAVRSAILGKLHSAMVALNEKVAKDPDSTKKALVLSKDELITMALDEEEKAAKGNPAVYANVIKLRIVKLGKMNKEDWEKEVTTHLNTRYYKIPTGQEPEKSKVLTTGLSEKEEIAVASRLITPLIGREKFGYVTKAPSQQEIESAKEGVQSAKGFEGCDRCGGRFQVFPGRREDGTLATGGACTFHPGKPIYPSRKQTDHITGDRPAYFPCCNETVGTSAGCTKAEYHVFKVSETKRLASILQFEETPSQPDKGPLPPVCFDCEMGYTTLGLELIRLTAVSWPEGKELVDVLVRPMGEILDLNSRFSGVRPEHYANAIPYGTSPPEQQDVGSEDGETKETPLQVVDSPAAARALLFKFLQPETPLIGHAIDNDLNACRIIHPTIIDTVILYPHPRGLPMRLGLKVLCKRYLDRDIQTAGDKGHDSKEDARATGDLVRVKVAETWKTLKRQGWTIEGDKLVAPPGVDPQLNPGRSVLGPGAGQKRKDPTQAEP
ncbi:RNA exonuclease Rex3, putative [Paecilomyces variotii No. 5]|uniref:RNA exonuclease 3 n=1 Tax=Byssochlamys spectabilis (strain No. 5 / NBRC 109023) TaxID=1356009 RepID=V5HXG8_BYSSN|nr:RNA exonuclease Rex3, putative [Paecilomyces variotii No. 5]